MQVAWVHITVFDAMVRLLKVSHLHCELYNDKTWYCDIVTQLDSHKRFYWGDVLFCNRASKKLAQGVMN